MPANGIERFFQISLLGMLACGYLAVVFSGHLDAPTTALAGAALGLRGLMMWGLARPRFSNRTVSLAALAYTVFYLVDYQFLSRDFLAATVHLVFFLASALVLTAGTNRQYSFLRMVAFLELLAASVLSANISFFLFLALFLVSSVAHMIASEIRRAAETAAGRNGPAATVRRLAAVTAFVSLGILATTAGLFFMLPRTARAAFQYLVSERLLLPGFSHEVRLGQIGEIQRQSTPLIHVRFAEGQPPALKWRGAALHRFDGRRWFNDFSGRQQVPVTGGQAWLADFAQIRRPGRRAHYEVHVRGSLADTLFFAGLPEFVQIDAPLLIRTLGGGYRLGYGSPAGARYSARSFLGGEPETAPEWTQISDEMRRQCTELPPMDPRIHDLVRRLTAAAGSDEQRARAIERHLSSQYGYTLELPARPPADPLADFLFERRRGHCEYFASSMAVMLRSAGIPSRVVTGFQSGIYNPISGWQVIRASDAHSWVEAFLGGRGWRIFDPTPPDPEARRLSFWSRWMLYADAAETFWQEWILGYDLSRQAVLADRMGQSGRSFSAVWLDRMKGLWDQAGEAVSKGPALLAPVIAAALAGLWLIGRRGRGWWIARRSWRRIQFGQVDGSDAVLLYRRMQAALDWRGYRKPSWMTPAEFARRLPAGELGVLVDEFTRGYNALRFGGEIGEAPRLVGLIEKLNRAASARS